MVVVVTVVSVCVSLPPLTRRVTSWLGCGLGLVAGWPGLASPQLPTNNSGLDILQSVRGYWGHSTALSALAPAAIQFLSCSTLDTLLSTERQSQIFLPPQAVPGEYLPIN